MYPAPSWDDFLSIALDETRLFGATSVQVTRRLRALLEDLHEVVPEFRAAPRSTPSWSWSTRAADRAFADRGDRLSAASRDRQGLGSAGARLRPPVDDKRPPR